MEEDDYTQYIISKRGDRVVFWICMGLVLFLMVYMAAGAILVTFFDI